MDKKPLKPTQFQRNHELLRLRGYENYDHYLASPAWEAFHKWYRKAQLPTQCLVCGDHHYQLHHIDYTNITQENLWDVIPLCGDHHLELHRWLEATGTPLHRVHLQLTSCFGMVGSKATAKLRKFKRLKEQAESLIRRCTVCRKRISLKAKLEVTMCWDCLKEHRKVLKAKGYTGAATTVATIILPKKGSPGKPRPKSEAQKIREKATWPRADEKFCKGCRQPMLLRHFQEDSKICNGCRFRLTAPKPQPTLPHSSE